VGDGAPHHHHPSHHLEVGLSQNTATNKQSCGSGFVESGSGYGFGSSISNESGSDTAEEKKYSRNFLFYLFLFYQKLQFTYPLASIKDNQTTGEASSTSKNEIY
jgi:hypothetical protein